MINTSPKRSLSYRMLLASLLLLPLFLTLGGALLMAAFKLSMETALQNQMQSQIYALMSDAEFAQGGLLMPDIAADPSFEHPTSEQFAWIVSGSELIWRSNSTQLLSDAQLSVASTLSAGEVQFVVPEGAEGAEAFYQLQHAVQWQLQGADIEVQFVVAHGKARLQSELAAFRHKMLLWLGALSLLLVATQFLITRWGLKPLSRIATELSALNTGEINQLSSDYPQEIAQVTESLNQVLQAQRQQRERYKNTLADLAHSLKTPLAIIRAEQNGLQPGVAEQVERMDNIIRHQLNRVHLGFQPLSGEIQLAPLVERVVNALSKLPDYAAQQIQMAIPEQIRLHAEQGDLMEVLGNLLENGCKYANQQLRISAVEHLSGVLITIEDDGPGIAPELRDKILQRGARADTANLGQGIGLAVVTDILSSYGAAIAIYRSKLGGAGISIDFPKLE